MTTLFKPDVEDTNLKKDEFKALEPEKDIMLTLALYAAL